jgi:zinc protease
MVFKGTRDYDADELADTVQAAGGHWNAYTSFDRTVYFIDGPSDSLPVFLKCLTGLVFFPVIPESEFEKEKDVIRREIDMGLDDPDNAATRLLFATAFQLDPRRHPVIGHRHRFDAVQYEDLTNYHRARYTTDRCFAVISGDFDPDEREETRRHSNSRLPARLRPRAARRHRSAAARPAPCPRNLRGPRQPDFPGMEITRARSPGRAGLRCARRHARPRPRLAPPPHAARGTRTRAGNFRLLMDRPRPRGLFAVSADATPDKRDALIEAIHIELAGLHSDSLDEDLAKAKRQIAASQFRSLHHRLRPRVRSRIELARGARSGFHPPPRRRHPGRHRGGRPPRRSASNRRAAVTHDSRSAGCASTC